MDTLYLLQFACFLFMFINILILGITRLHMKWMNRRYEVSRWLIIGAMVGLAIQFLMQMLLGFRAQDALCGSRFQHSGLSPLLLAHLYWHLQYRGNACQPPEDEHRLRQHLCRHIGCLLHRLYPEGKLPYRQLDLYDDSPVRHQRSLLHLYDNSGNQKAQKDAGGDGWL